MDTTRRVFNAIRKAKPVKLFISADGPRENRAGEKEQCQKVKDIVCEVDWECEVYHKFSEKNLGCRVAVSSAINWFFENVHEGIILEDDCVPAKSFFRFCQELLEKYRYDERIMSINGNNFLLGKKRIKESYYFSRIPGCWGWATWRRAWRHFDKDMKCFTRFQEDDLINNYHSNKEISNWHMSCLEEANKPNCSIWSTQWIYAIMTQNGLCVYPAKNLIQNIGFAADATHCKHESFWIYSKFVLDEINKITHPPFILPDIEADSLHFEIIKKTDPRLTNKNRIIVLNMIKRIIPGRIQKIIKTLSQRV